MRNQIDDVYILNKEADEIMLFAAMSSRLNKIEALSSLTTAEDFLDYNEKMVRNYFWTIEEFIGEVIEIVSVLEKRSLDKSNIALY